jgi:hypothetical protein
MLQAQLHQGYIGVYQSGNFTFELKQVLKSLHEDSQWDPKTQIWWYPYTPAVVQSLADVAEVLRVRLELDDKLKEVLASIRKEFDHELSIRQQMQKCLDDRNIPMADYPTLMAPPPWWHQKLAYHWGVRTRVMYMALKPGLGKSRAASDILRGKHSIGHVRKPEYIELPERYSRAIKSRVLKARWGIRGGILVACPRAVIGEWTDQLWRFQNIEAVPIVGRDAETKRRAAGTPAWVHVCSYESLEAVEDNEYDGVIADEGHWLANEESNRSQRMLVLRESAAWALVLSGTPIPNQLPSLWAQFYWLDGGRTLGPTFAYYKRKFLKEGKWIGQAEGTPEERVTNAIARITLFMDMRTAFPGKKEKIQQIIRVPLTEEQISYYENVRVRSIADVATGRVTAMEGMQRVMKLLEIVQGFVIDDNGNTQQFSSAKLKALEDMLAGQGDLVDRKVIVWASFRHDLVSIGEMLKRRNIPHMFFRGGMSDAQTAELRQKWNNDPNVLVLLGMIQIGIGVNLHAPTCVTEKGEERKCYTTVFYGLNDKVTQVEQAMDRIYRGDQTETCLYRYILSDGLDAEDASGKPLIPVDVRMYQTLQLKLEQGLRMAEGSVEYVRMLLGDR